MARSIAIRPLNALAGGSGKRLSVLALSGLARQRRQLSRLDDRQLQDIGLTRAAAEAEADRPVWDVPKHWRA